MQIAFKEWAIVVDALGHGDQIIILRKGGIAEGRGGFKMEHSEFLLFPTLFHQQRESVTPSAQKRFDQISPGLPSSDVLRIEYFARVAEWQQLDSLKAAQNLRGQHIWRDEVIRERFDWGKSKNIFAIAIRVFRLSQRIELPMISSYGGCKSWISLDRDISSAGAIPVLDDNTFTYRLQKLRESLALTSGDNM